MPNKVKREIKDRARTLLEDPIYVEALRIRLLRGEAGPTEMLLFHYAYGKPRETVAVEGGTLPLPLVVKLTGEE